MKIYSFVRDGLKLNEIEVEVSLMPGLPLFEVTGLADVAIKESLARLKSALKNSSFDLPQRQRVLFNLKPSYFRKKSEGLDLAFAVGYLLISGQVRLQATEAHKLYVYGEVGLSGDVTVSNEIELLSQLPEDAFLLTGDSKSLFSDHYKVSHLSQLDNLQKADCADGGSLFLRPPLSTIQFCKKSARLMTIIAAGEHTTLLAGPAGSGKSTWVQSLHSVLRDLDHNEQKEVKRIAKVMGRDIEWRPFVSPHHTTPTMSLMGGGATAAPGEITRAHKGVLFLDEFLEFSTQAKEAFREPMETGQIHLARKGVVQKYPAESLVIAATNLCRCGEWVPNYQGSCRFSLAQCRAYLMKLSGPLLDRFDVLALSHQWKGPKEVSLNEVYEAVIRAQKFSQNVRGQVVMNSKLSLDQAKQQCDLRDAELFGASASLRRDRALYRVARTIADIEGSQLVRAKHLNEALEITSTHFDGVKRAMN